MKRSSSSSSSSSKSAKGDDNGDSELELGENNNIYLAKVKQPYISGAYIRSFVKQLTSSSRAKPDPPSMREKGTSLEREAAMSPPPPPPPKKQVRRRLHTRKPYQEKLLNMAEARREIVTALKLHRASMKQASDHRPDSPSRPDSPTEGLKARKHHPGTTNPPGFSSPYSWAAPPPPPPPVFDDFVLPSQTLGLNLNLQDFIAAPWSVFSASSPSTSSSSPPPSAASEETPAMAAVAMGEGEELVGSPFDEVMEFPAWLNADESCLQHVNDFCYFQDPALPCMEIEEIEGMDGDWLV